MGGFLGKAAVALLGERHEKPVSILKTMIPVRGLAIAFVVMAHSVIYMLAIEVNASPGEHLGPVLFGQWQIASVGKSIVLELCRCAVPLFFFLTGYYTLMAPRTWAAIWSNCKKLVIPMATWSLLGWLFSWRDGNGGWNVLEFLKLFLTGRVQNGYFFIVLIVQYYVMSKWLVPVMERRPALILGLSAVIQLAVHGYDYLYLLSRLELPSPMGLPSPASPFPECLFPRFMFSFALGIYASRSSDRFKRIIGPGFRPVVAAAALSALLMAYERGLIFYRGYAVLGFAEFEATATSWVEWKISTALWSIAAVFLVFGFFQRRIPLRPLLEKLGKYSFQIFILHGFVLDVSNAILYKFPDRSIINGVLGCLALFAAGIGLPVAMTKAIRRFVPARLRILLIGA